MKWYLFGGMVLFNILSAYMQERRDEETMRKLLKILKER
jgi:hypothetical protein